LRLCVSNPSTCPFLSFPAPPLGARIFSFCSSRSSRTLRDLYPSPCLRWSRSCCLNLSPTSSVPSFILLCLVIPISISPRCFRGGELIHIICFRSVAFSLLTSRCYLTFPVVHGFPSACMSSGSDLLPLKVFRWVSTKLRKFFSPFSRSSLRRILSPLPSGQRISLPRLFLALAHPQCAPFHFFTSAGFIKVITCTRSPPLLIMSFLSRLLLMS